MKKIKLCSEKKAQKGRDFTASNPSKPLLTSCLAVGPSLIIGCDMSIVYYAINSDIV